MKLLKVIQFCIFSLHFACVFSQTVFPINENNEIEYSEVVTVDSTSSDKLYSRAKMIISELFKSAQNVIQNDDAVNKQILIKGNIKSDYSWNPLSNCPGHIDFTLIIMCKDNRYKYILKPGNHVFEPACKISGGGGGSLLLEKPACGTFNMPKSYWEDIKSKANSDFLAFIKLLKSKMATEIGGKNDW
ncbi:MAG: DUF4468 domain-containing protein [Flavobacteriales bacterium]|nr:DUF4468 domain-containing protein [Flavobacteriales bacterium]